MPASASTDRAISVAGLGGRRRSCAPPDCTIAWWNRPCAAGRPRSVPTLIPPADSPKMVTWSGSPPNAAMLSRTHSSAHDLVEDAGVARAGELRAEDLVEVQEPERAEPVVDADDHDVAVRRRSGCRRRSAIEPVPFTNAPPWIQNITGRFASSSAGV